MAAKRVTVVTGLTACGKTWYCKDLVARDASFTHVAADAHRYVAGTWTKLPKDDFIAAVRAAIDAAPTPNVVLDTIYRDGHDASAAREALVDQLLAAGVVDHVYIWKPESLQHDLLKLVSRSLARATGEQPQGAAPETATSVTALVLKFVRQYEANVAALDDCAKRFEALITWLQPCGCTE
jgi:hypothetical protein